MPHKQETFGSTPISPIRNTLVGYFLGSDRGHKARKVLDDGYEILFAYADIARKDLVGIGAT